MNYLNLIILILVSILFSAFFSGMEIAFVSSNKLRTEIDRKQKKVFAGLVSFFTKHPSRFIATMLVGNNIALVIYGITFAMLLEEPLRNILGGNAEAALLLVQTLISTPPDYPAFGRVPAQDPLPDQSQQLSPPDECTHHAFLCDPIPGNPPYHWYFQLYHEIPAKGQTRYRGCRTRFWEGGSGSFSY